MGQCYTKEEWEAEQYYRKHLRRRVKSDDWTQRDREMFYRRKGVKRYPIMAEIDHDEFGYV